MAGSVTLVPAAGIRDDDDAVAADEALSAAADAGSVDAFAAVAGTTAADSWSSLCGPAAGADCVAAGGRLEHQRN